MVSAALLVVLSLSVSPGALPAPPPPASPTHIVASTLVSALLSEPSRLPATSTYTLTVRMVGEPKERLTTFFANQLEAALNRRVSGVTRHQPMSALMPTHRVDVTLTLNRAHLSAEARLIQLPRSLWEWLRVPQGVLLHTAVSSAQMDLELRQLSEHSNLVGKFKRLRYVDITKRSAKLDAPVLDMIHEDLDGDGFPELVCLQAERLVTLRWSEGGLQVVDHAPLEGETRRLRQPMGRLVILTMADGKKTLLVASSARARTTLWRYQLDGWKLVEESAASGHWPLYSLGVGEWLTRGILSDRGALEAPTIGLATPSTEGGYIEQALAATDEPIYGLRAFAFFQASTPSWMPFLLKSSPGSGLQIWSPLEPTRVVSLPEAGDAATVCDLDANGAPELIHTSSALRGPDRLTWMELTGPRSGRTRWTKKSAWPVSALVATDLDGDGYEEVVASSWRGDDVALHLISPLVTR